MPYLPSDRRPRSPWKKRYFIDTEFTNFEAESCQLISIAIVGETGEEFYGESSDFDRSLCSRFVKENVLPQLGNFPDRSMPNEVLGRALMTWLLAAPLKPRPILSYDSDWDYQLLVRLLRGPLPQGWRHENVFLKIRPERFAQFISTHGGRHHALQDARANAFAFT
ncbi:3'-5' exoribonuclease.1 [Pandoraea commovens]|uniref:3'-5' exoribonuclease.1 n=1 Tax=Pandoraea commovens TaxID=2508289 RepID=A0A5E4RK94_9BURK|nr:3'-5' exoribonuclease [Pandoraea commovens]VVD62924.1 3'-5' exoribonuclease.1 [Pandoraea commovens]